MSWKNSFIIQQIAALFAKIEVKKDDIVETTASVEKKSQEKAIMEKQEVKVEQKTDEKEYIGIEDFAKLDLRIGTIVACEAIEGSDKLLKSQVDFGDLGMRQVLSGIRKAYSADQMVGKQALFVVNLKPRKMMGHDSQGMMLLALDELIGLKVMSPEDKVKPGTKVG